MELPPAIDPQEILQELIEGIAIDAQSPEDATRIVDELLAFLGERLHQVDWASEIENEESGDPGRWKGHYDDDDDDEQLGPNYPRPQRPPPRPFNPR